MAERTIVMTEGKPLGLILKFALPLMLGNVCQQLYTMVDTMIVGNGVGVEALASLGAADWLNWMVLSAITGFAQGFSILVSQHVGARNEAKIRQSVVMSCALSIGLVVVLTLAAHLLCEPVLGLLNTPENVIGGSITYLRVMFSGIFATMAYNLFSAILRAFGDSKTPLIAMLIGSVTNIGLDMLFVYAFGWGIFGAAIATVIAQCLAALFCLLYLLRWPVLKMQRQDLVFDRDMVTHLLRLGSPVAFQNAIISVGGLVVQYVVNGFGFLFVAGFTATNKLYGLLELAAVSYGYAVATYAGQNLGAGKIERIREGIRAAIKLFVGTSLVISLMMIILGKPLVGLFVSAEATSRLEVIDIAYRYLFMMAIFLSVLFLLHLYRNALQGMGNTLIPMISGLIELVMRIGAALLLPLWLGQNGIYLAEILAWIGAEVFLMVNYYRDLGSRLH